MIQNGPTQMVAGNIFEGLLRYSPKLEPLPGLAESWTVSDDAKVYTFKLKPGVTWHDGKPFTSADVLFSIEMLKQTHARARNNMVQVEKVEAPDDLTVVFTLKQPLARSSAFSRSARCRSFQNIFMKAPTTRPIPTI